MLLINKKVKIDGLRRLILFFSVFDCVMNVVVSAREIKVVESMAKFLSMVVVVLFVVFSVFVFLCMLLGMLVILVIFLVLL